MRILLSLIAVFLLNFEGFSQNLIPNPGFEQCDKCDSRGFKELGIGFGANDPIDWNAATFGTPDIYSIFPNTGKKHGGFFLGFPKYEYLTNHFTNPLVQGATYLFSFWISPNTQNLNYIIDEIGVFIQSGPAVYPQAAPLKQISPTFVSPDKDFIKAIGYRQFLFEYKACGGEDHFIVGRFKSLEIGDTIFVGSKRPTNPANEPIYYFVDDFEMLELIPPPTVDLLPEKINLCPGEKKSIRIQPPYDQEIILWSTGETTASIDVPSQTTLSVEITLNDFCKTKLRDTVKILLEQEINIKILGPDSICIGDTVMLKALCNGNCFNINWNTNKTTESILITSPGIYTVSANTNCSTITSQKEVFPSNRELKSFIQFPNVIFPFGEEANRSFGPVIEFSQQQKNRIHAMKLVIYNRWGQKIFETNNIDGKWLPESNIPLETYLYFAEFEYQDCDRIRKSAMKGSFTIVK